MKIIVIIPMFAFAIRGAFAFRDDLLAWEDHRFANYKREIEKDQAKRQGGDDERN